MQATVTLKGSTAEAMTLAFCAYITEGVLEILAEYEQPGAMFEVGLKVQARVQGVLGEELNPDALRAMAMRIRTATLELPPVSVRIGNVQMALPTTPAGPEDEPEVEVATLTVEEIPTDEIAEVLAEAGLDVVVLKGPASAEEITEAIAEPQAERISAFELVDRVMTKADLAGGWGGETEATAVDYSDDIAFGTGEEPVETDEEGEDEQDD